MAIGLGVAIARASRSRPRPAPRRGAGRLGLTADEPLLAGLRRMALAQVDIAVELLQGRNGGLDERAVHETRKALKRLRALVRLLRAQLGEETYARENAALRDVAGRLSGARDAEVALATLDALVGRHPRKLGRRRGVRVLRRHLAARHEQVERRSLHDADMRSRAIVELLAFRARAVAWELDGGDGAARVGGGLERIYAQGRRRYRRAARSKRARRTRALHAWRKRVKDLRYAAEALQRPRAAGSGANQRKRVRKQDKPRARLHRVERNADELGELLGEDHDLAVLAELIAAERTANVGKRTRKLLLKRIDRRRRRLQKRALAAGARLYDDGAGRFRRRVRAAYRPAC